MKRKDKKVNYYLKIFQKNWLLLCINILVAIITSAAAAGIALLLKRIVDIAVSGDMNSFTKALIFNLVYLAVFAVLFFVGSLLSKILMRNVIKNLRKSIFNGIFGRSFRDYYEVNTADYISVLTNDIKMVEDNYIQPLMGMIQNLFAFVFTIILLFKISPIIVLILFIGLILMLLIPGLIGQRLQKKQEVLSEGYSVFTAKLKDFFSGYEVIKTFNLLGHTKKEFNNENNILASKKYKADRLFVLNETVSQFMAIFSQTITIFVATYLVIQGSITVGSLIAIIQLSGSFVMPLVFIMQNFPKIQSVAPVMKRMQEFDNDKEITLTGKPEPIFKNKIVLSDVSFAYHENQPVLEKVSLEFEKGKKYAIVGESGCGKSTLVKLIMGYYLDYTGNISFDNASLKECEVEKISELASIIHQNVYMFDRTILDNICLFQKYSTEDINEVVTKSGVDKFLAVMQNQLETLVGENGANLSGGQRQRIAIARALVKRTPVLILDEGTSAIDLQTSNEIEKNILNIKDLTLITISHKLNDELLSMYDKIIYMDKGRVKEIGSYSELIFSKKDFYNFCVT